MSIYCDIIDFQMQERIAGREPKHIDLTGQQIGELEAWVNESIPRKVKYLRPMLKRHIAGLEIREKP